MKDINPFNTDHSKITFLFSVRKKARKTTKRRINGEVRCRIQGANGKSRQRQCKFDIVSLHFKLRNTTFMNWTVYNV